MLNSFTLYCFFVLLLFSIQHDNSLVIFTINLLLAFIFNQCIVHAQSWYFLYFLYFFIFSVFSILPDILSATFVIYIYTWFFILKRRICMNVKSFRYFLCNLSVFHIFCDILLVVFTIYLHMCNFSFSFDIFACVWYFLYFFIFPNI